MQTNKNGSLVLSKNEYLIAGSLSGFVSRAIVQPLDVLKIRFQLQVEPISASSSSKYHGFAQAIRCISKEEGASAFWKGLIPAQLQAVTFSAMQFLSFEVLVSLFVQFNQHGGARRDPRSSLKSSNTFGTFACGCIAGSISAGFTQPLDVLRTRFIAQGEPKLYRSMTHAALYITSHEGVSGFFRGLVPSLLLVAPQTGLQFAIYHTFNRLVETVYDSWNKTKDRRDLNTLSEETQTISGTTKDNTHVFNVGPVLSLVSGGLAGMGSKCVIYPLDMVKKRMQIQGFEEGRTGFGRVPTSRGMCDCLMKIWTTEGAVALFKGLRPTLLKSCVSISCRFTVYEQVCQLIYHLRHESTSGRTF